MKFSQKVLFFDKCKNVLNLANSFFENSAIAPARVAGYENHWYH